MFYFSRGWPWGNFNPPEYNCNCGYISLKQKTTKEKKKKRLLGNQSCQKVHAIHSTGETLYESLSSTDMQLNNLHSLSRFGRFRSPENSKVRATTSKKKQKNWRPLLKQETESFLDTNPKSTLGPHKVGMKAWHIPQIPLSISNHRERNAKLDRPLWVYQWEACARSHGITRGYARLSPHPVIFIKILFGSGIQEQPEKHSNRSQTGRGLGSRCALWPFSVEQHLLNVNHTLVWPLLTAAGVMFDSADRIFLHEHLPTWAGSQPCPQWAEQGSPWIDQHQINCVNDERFMRFLWHSLITELTLLLFTAAVVLKTSSTWDFAEMYTSGMFIFNGQHLCYPHISLSLICFCLNGI